MQPTLKSKEGHDLKKAAGPRDLSNYREIFEDIEKELRVELAKEERNFLSSVPADGSATRNHMADSNAPNYAAETRAALIKENLRHIAAAKKRLKNGTFGICVDPECGARIEDARLFKNPFVDKCYPCQQEDDKEAARQRKLNQCRGTLPGKH